MWASFAPPHQRKKDYCRFYIFTTAWSITAAVSLFHSKHTFKFVCPFSLFCAWYTIIYYPTPHTLDCSLIHVHLLWPRCTQTTHYWIGFFILRCTFYLNLYLLCSLTFFFMHPSILLWSVWKLHMQPCQTLKIDLEQSLGTIQCIDPPPPNWTWGCPWEPAQPVLLKLQKITEEHWFREIKFISEQADELRAGLSGVRSNKFQGGSFTHVNFSLYIYPSRNKIFLLEVSQLVAANYTFCINDHVFI